MAKMKVALYGAGAMGSHHARVISQSSHSELKYVVETNIIRGQALAQAHNSKWLPDLKDFEDIDYVIIATPSESHNEIARVVITAKIPLLLEKPVSANLVDSIEIINLSMNYETLLMCGLVERFNPAVLTLQEIVREPMSIQSIRHSPFIERVTTDIDGDLLIHDLDIAINLFGKMPLEIRGLSQITNVGGKFVRNSMEVIGKFSETQIFNLSASRLSQRKIRTLNVSESKKLYEVDLLRRDITIYRNIHEESTNSGLGYKQETVIEIPNLVTQKEPLVAQLDNFIDMINRNDSNQRERERNSLLKLHKALYSIEMS
jgi:predicted dehydrogenase